MSKSRIGIAVVVLAMLLSSPAVGKVRLGPLGGLFGFTRLFVPGGLYRAHSVARRGHTRNVALRSREIRPPQDTRPSDTRGADARAPETRSADIRGAVDSGRVLGDPAERAQLVAAAALAGWHGGRIANGWWRHSDGGYGWVGPLFWPFATHDIYGYTIRGDGNGFWDYGYGDIYAAIFAPYRQDDLATYAAADASGSTQAGLRQRNVPSLQRLCDDDSREIGGLIDQMQQTVQPTETQRAALDDLRGASVEAARIVQASCPKETPSTAPARLAAMRARIEAMTRAELSVQEPLEKFYKLLDDGQKAQLQSWADEQRKDTSTQGCRIEPSPALQWPADEIEATLHPNDAQRAALDALRSATARAVEMLSYDCQPNGTVTPPARLDAMDRRLYALQQAINVVSVALDDFYETLSDEQKAQFEAIGPKRTA